MASKRIYFAFSGGLGTFIRLVPIMEILRARGHTLAYSAIDDVTKKMDALGFDRVEIPWVSGQDTSVLPPETPTWYDAGDYWAALGYKDRAWVRRLWKTYRDAIATFAPDVIVGDFGIEAHVAAELLGTPFAAVTQSCYHPDVKGGRLRYWDPLPASKPSIVEEVNDTRADLGLAAVQRFEDLFVGDVTIIPSFPEFDELSAIPPTTQYVGPILWDGLSNVSCRLATRPGRRSVFVYTGRLQDFVGDSGLLLLRACVECFGGTDVDVTISHGGVLAAHGESVDGAALIGERLPPNINVVDWAPLEFVYSNFDVIVHHGGHGSCMATMLHGGPSLVVPTHSEREYNARALVRLGAGLMVLPGQANRTHLWQSAMELLDNPSYRVGAAKWKAEIAKRSYGGARRAAKLIEGLIDGRGQGAVS